MSISAFTARHTHKAWVIVSLILAAAVWPASASAQTITSEQIYENPDDTDLNLRYAKQEIRKGELLNAAAALERILFVHSDWHSARLLYAAVLYRLDDQKAANRELSLLEGKPLNEEQKATLVRYKSEFKTPPRFQEPAGAGFDPFKGQIAIGVRYDDNAGNALTDAGFGFNNQDDVSVFLNAGIVAQSKIKNTNDMRVRFEVSGALRAHETFSRSDYAMVNGGVGLSGSAGDGRITAMLNARQINISGERYLRQIGPNLTYSKEVSKDTVLSASGSVYTQNYDALNFAPLEDARDGTKASLSLGVFHTPNDKTRLTASLGYTDKSADIDAFAYSGPVAAIGIDRMLGNDWTLKARGSIRKFNYDGTPLFIGPDRDDTRINGRVAVAKSLVDMGILKSNNTFKDIGVEFGVHINDRNSNINTFDYDNVGADVRLVFGF